ncbi:MAG: glycosyl transferase [Chryseobacterium sp.]|nr:MAG: glycosyl transferase [Chryseobacterium sp.]
MIIMNEAMPFVSIIIPTYKDWDRLKLCLEALEKQSFPQNFFEVLVVNNDPEDEFANRFPIADNVTILNEPKAGSYVARNTALDAAKGSLIGFTDSDCIPDINWIKNAVKVFSTDKTIDRIAGRLKMFYPNKNVSLADLYDATFAFPQEDYTKSGFCVTGNLFTKKELFDTVGYFDEKVMSGGDSKWGLEATKKGFNMVYSADVFVSHPTRSSLEDLKIKMKRVGKGLKNILPDDKKKHNVLVQIFIYIVFRMPEFFKDARKRNPDLNIIDSLRVSSLHAYLLFLRDQEKYKLV